MTLNAVGQPGGGGGQPTHAAQELREQVHKLSNEYNNLFNQFWKANNRHNPSEDDSSD